MPLDLAIGKMGGHHLHLLKIIFPHLKREKTFFYQQCKHFFGKICLLDGPVHLGGTQKKKLLNFAAESLGEVKPVACRPSEKLKPLRSVFADKGGPDGTVGPTGL
ncbi:MAG TPA: hypothetical protein QF761_12945 [Pirellulales bacterium]|nr:hypothetical protein [Pirellulales bacterium]